MPNVFKPEWLGDLSQRRPWAVLLVVLAVTMAAAYGVRNIESDDQLGAYFRSETAAYQAFSRMRALFPASDRQVYLVVTAPDLATPEKLAVLRDLHLDLALLGGVENVLSILSARHPPDENGETAPVFPEVLPRGERLRALIEANRANPFLSPKMLSADASATVLVVLLDAAIADRESFAPVWRAIDALAAEKAGPAGLTVRTTGYQVFTAELSANLNRDRLVLNLSGLAITILICIFFLGGIRLTVITALPAVVALIWSMGGFGLLGQKITPLTNILPPLVLVIAFSTALHLVYRFRTKLGEGYRRGEAMHIALREIGPACALTCLTTATALGLLVISSSPVIRQMGLFGSGAVLVTYFIMITVVPAAAALLFRETAEAGRKIADTRLLKLAKRLSRMSAHAAMRHSGAIVAAGIVFLTATASAYLSLSPFYFYRYQLPVDSASLAATRTVDEKLGGLDAVHITVERRNTADKRATDADLAVVRQAHELLARGNSVSYVWSPETMLRWLQGATGTGGASLLDTSGELSDFQRDYLERLTSKRAPAWLVTGFLADTDPAIIVPLLRAMEREVAELDAANPDYRIAMAGLFPLSTLESRRMIAVLQGGLVAAIALAFAAIAVWFGSVRIAAISMLPNILPITAAATFIYFVRPGLQMSHVVALIVAFGIAVDDTVQFLRRFTLERRSMSVPDAVAWTTTHVGPVLIATSVILGLGFGVTVLSNLPSIQMFGLLCLVVFAVALLGDILVLPAMLLMARRALGRARPAPRRESGQ